MQRPSNRKLLRKMLVLSMLSLGLMTILLDRATPVSAKTCLEANNDFYDSLAVFDAAFSLFYHNNPTSCQQDCAGIQDPQLYQLCRNLCEQNRRSALDAAQLGILQAGSEITNCTNHEPDFCTNAQARDDDCIANYNYLEFTDLDQRLDMFTTYFACRSSTGIDQCQ